MLLIALTHMRFNNNAVLNAEYRDRIKMAEYVTQTGFPYQRRFERLVYWMKNSVKGIRCILAHNMDICMDICRYAWIYYIHLSPKIGLILCVRPLDCGDMGEALNWK